MYAAPWKSGASAPRKARLKSNFVIPNRAKGPVRNLLLTFAVTTQPTLSTPSFIPPPTSRSTTAHTYCFKIQLAIFSSATGDMVSSISEYSAGAPVFAV